MCWNDRGLEGQRAFHNMNSLVLESSTDMLFISETKLCKSSTDLLCCCLKFPNCLCIGAIGRSGGLALFWNNNINTSILSYSNGHIDCYITAPLGPFYFIDFYGNLTQGPRHLSWSLLNKITTTHSNLNVGWL